MEEETLTGSVETIVYVQPDNGFTVARLKETGKRDLVVVVGYFPSLHPGEEVICKGVWKTHPTYGRQFEMRDCQIETPSDVVGIQKYLESGLVKGIGAVFAQKIVSRFGRATLRVIEEQPRRLLEIPGIGAIKMQRVVECWQQQREIRKVMIFLRAHGVSPAFAQKIFKAYGDRSIERVQENPYQLAKDIFGIGFKTADLLAQKLGLPLESAQRISAGIEFVLWELTTEGHTCYPQVELVPLVREALQVDEGLIAHQIGELVAKQDLVQRMVPLDCGKSRDIDQGQGSVLMLWLKPFARYEEGIGHDLDRLLRSSQVMRSVDQEKAVDWVQRVLCFRLAIQQEAALKCALVDKMHIITGGPGTGKSTIINSLLAICSKITDKILLAAPTGRAAKRLSEITRRKAFTLHALLEWNPVGGGFKRGRDNPLACDLMIVDESSMIDTPLMFFLLRAIPNGSRVIFVGDIDQLPSVGPGTVLRDLIESNKIGVTRLTEIFRQAKGSKIVTNAHLINQGLFPDCSFNPKSDFQFIASEDPQEIQSIVLRLVSQEIPAQCGFHPIDEIQVLSPMKRGVIGIEVLNEVLQATLNPRERPFFHAGRRFHLGDKVMQLRNNYNRKVMNGDLGRIEEIDGEEKTVRVSFEDRVVSYEFSDMDELTLAYATSVHKYQGSECPCVVIPLHTTHFKLLQKNLLYTAVTRGKKRVYLVGSKKAVGIALHNNQVSKRYTGLRSYLNSSFLR